MSWLNPFEHLKFVSPWEDKPCPYCFEEFHLGDCAIVSAVNSPRAAAAAAATEEPPPMMGAAGAPPEPPPDSVLTPRARRVIVPRPQWHTRLSSRFLIRRTDGGQMVKQMARRECPHCEKLLPPEIDEMDNVIIGLVGGSRAGKTHYIAALINELEREAALEPFGCTRFAPIDDDVREHYQKNYYEPLFVHKRVLARNDANNRPLPLSYTMLFRDPGSSELKRATLILFDGPGEFMQTKSGVTTETRYILNAEALIFLVDPMSIRTLVEKMPANHRPSSNPALTVEAFSILNDVYDLAVYHNRQKQGDQLSTPAAVAISKADLLKWVPDLGHEVPSFLKPSDKSELFDAEAVKHRSEAVEAILRQYSAPALLQTAKLFSNVSYHAISATGCQMDEQQQTFAEVKPMRCIDPLVSVLRELGYISPLEPPVDAPLEEPLDDVRASVANRPAPTASPPVSEEGPPPFPGQPEGAKG